MKRAIMTLALIAGLIPAATDGALSQERMRKDLMTGSTVEGIVEALREPPTSKSFGVVAAVPTALLKVEFAFNSADLTAQAQAELMKLVQALADPALAGAGFLIEGHTDAVGSPTYNQGLSERRAGSAVRFLVSRGVTRARLTGAGCGESLLLPGITPEDGRNRRVEVVRQPAGICSN